MPGQGRLVAIVVRRSRRERAAPLATYGFQVPWVIDQVDLNHTDSWLAHPGGSVTHEFHKRPSGVLAVVGFVNDADAQALTDPRRTLARDVVIYEAANDKARHAVSVPIARIESFIHGRTEISAVSSIEVAVW